MTDAKKPDPVDPDAGENADKPSSPDPSPPRNKQKSVDDGDAIAEIGDDVGGPA